MTITNEPQARRAWVGLSWFLSLLMAYRGGEQLLAGNKETRPVAVMLLIAALVICPPIVRWLRGFVPILRSPWSPPALAVALLFLSVLATVVPQELSKRASLGGPGGMSEVDETMTSPAEYAAFAQVMLERHLTDPQSLQLYSLTAFRNGEELALCGTFNARNRIGGYVGESPFVISDRGVFLGSAVTAAVARDCAGVTVTEVPRGTLR